jgi:hypothetical protein
MPRLPLAGAEGSNGALNGVPGNAECKVQFTVQKAGFSMIERRTKSRQVIEEIGGASRDRTDDLIVANDNALRLRHHNFNNLESDYVPLRSENLNCGSQMVRQKLHPR